MIDETLAARAAHILGEGRLERGGHLARLVTVTGADLKLSGRIQHIDALFLQAAPGPVLDVLRDSRRLDQIQLRESRLLSELTGLERDEKRRVERERARLDARLEALGAARAEIANVATRAQDQALAVERAAIRAGVMAGLAARLDAAGALCPPECWSCPLGELAAQVREDLAHAGAQDVDAQRAAVEGELAARVSELCAAAGARDAEHLAQLEGEAWADREALDVDAGPSEAVARCRAEIDRAAQQRSELWHSVAEARILARLDALREQLNLFGPGRPRVRVSVTGLITVTQRPEADPDPRVALMAAVAARSVLRDMAASDAGINPTGLWAGEVWACQLCDGRLSEAPIVARASDLCAEQRALADHIEGLAVVELDHA